jgi:hypothetical protein
MAHLYKNTTNYQGFLKRYYFEGLIKAIIRLGELENINKKILDFGCGVGKLKYLLKNKNPNVINYDVVQELSDVKNWDEKYFDILVANEVFYTFDQVSLEKLLLELKNFNRDMTLVVGISKQSLLNKIGALLLNDSKAHYGTKLKPLEEINTLKKYTNVILKKNYLFLVDIYLLKFN